MSTITEKRQAYKMEQSAERYFSKYRDQMEALESSHLSKVRKLEAYDYYALGKQLEQFDETVSLMEEEGNVNLLGKIPTIAYDVITAQMGVSIIPLIASVQPIEEEQGLVYFKNVRAGNTKGDLTAGDVLQDPRNPTITGQGYAGNMIEGEVVGTGDAAEIAFNATLAAGPVKSESLVVNAGAGVYGKDVGNGIIMGVGVSGTINYLTGAVVLNFAVAPANAQDITVGYQLNYELDEDIPTIDIFFDSKLVPAEVHSLRGTIGMLQSFGMKKRFGLNGFDELAKDLVTEINKEIGGKFITKMRAAAVGSTTFYKTPPTGVSYFEHKNTIKDKIAEAERVLSVNAGRGVINAIIAGSELCEVMSTINGFTKISDGKALGAHLYGTLDGVPVIRVLETKILPAREALLMWKGLSAWEAPAVYTPFMPLTVTDAIPLSPNPLTSQRAAAVWSGIDVIVPKFITKMVLDPGAQP